MNNKSLLIIIVLAAGLLSAYHLPPKSIYRLRFRDIEGSVVNMNRYQGKKILIMTVPTQESDTSLLSQLSFFAARFKDTVSIIGVLSLEAGYRHANKATIKTLYREKRKLDLLLTEGMHTLKSADSTQAGLMRWLTDKDENGHFDFAVKGVGQKFFVDERGDLYAVLGPEVPLSHKIIGKIVQRPQRLRPIPSSRTTDQVP